MKHQKDSGFWHSHKIYRDGSQKGFGTDKVAHLLWQTLTRRQRYPPILSHLVFLVTVVRSRNKTTLLKFPLWAGLAFWIVPTELLPIIHSCFLYIAFENWALWPWMWKDVKGICSPRFLLQYWTASDAMLAHFVVAVGKIGLLTRWINFQVSGRNLGQ